MSESATQDIKIAAVTSIPRLGFNDHWGCILDALGPFKIPVRRFTGAFWGQHLQTVLEGCVADGLDWVLTLDYDTLFSARHVDALIHAFAQNPKIDALAAMQPRRNTGMPLMTVKGPDGKPKAEIQLNGQPVKAATAHFGLTLIRVEALKTLPKPWFTGVAGPDGTWTHDEKIDPDIWFWKQWEKAGKTVYVAPDVRVGHLEMMVSELDANLKHRWVTVPDWRKANTDTQVRSA